MDTLAGQADLNVRAQQPPLQMVSSGDCSLKAIVTVLKLQYASESLGGLRKTHMAGPHFQNFWHNWGGAQRFILTSSQVVLMLVRGGGTTLRTTPLGWIMRKISLRPFSDNRNADLTPKSLEINIDLYWNFLEEGTECVHTAPYLARFLRNSFRYCSSLQNFTSACNYHISLSYQAFSACQLYNEPHLSIPESVVDPRQKYITITTTLNLLLLM